jgi:hypothetical protein
MASEVRCTARCDPGTGILVSCEISVRARETRREPIRDRIYGQRENDGNAGSRALTGFRRRGSVDHDDLDIRAHKLGCKLAQPIVSARRVALLDEDVLAFDIAPRPQPLAEGMELLLVRARAARGRAAAAPRSSVMNWRRFT